MAQQVFTTLQQTKEIAQGAAQGALDLVAAQHYITESGLDTALTESTEIQDMQTAIDNKVSATVDRNKLIFS